MTDARQRISLGALALILCLALPMGVLSLSSGTTTGEQVDVAELIFVGRVAALQQVDEPRSVVVRFDVDRVLVGEPVGREFLLRSEGARVLGVGDVVLALIDLDEGVRTLLGAYRLDKSRATGGWEVVTPVTGMAAQGVVGGDYYNPIPVPLMEQAIRDRLASAGGVMAPVAPPIEGEPETTVNPDPFEPNETIDAATPIHIGNPTFLTGTPTLITALTLTAGDVDFFEFNAGELLNLFAKTLQSDPNTIPDTVLGVFDPNGTLVAFNDDALGDPDTSAPFSALVVPTDQPGVYSIAVAGAPDDTFAGGVSAERGSYQLSIELQIGSYIWNGLDLIAGVSPDGTFIEQFIGLLEKGDPDVLLQGVPADGWGVHFDVSGAGVPGGLTTIFGGAGDQLADPGFTHPTLPLAFDLSDFMGPNGINRRGASEASAIVPYTLPGLPQEGVSVTHRYTMALDARQIVGEIDLVVRSSQQVDDLAFARVLDIDLFGDGSDTFIWTFDPSRPVKAFPVDSATTVGDVVAPAQAMGSILGDRQAALLIEPDPVVLGKSTYPVAFTLVSGFNTETEAQDEAARALMAKGITTYVIASDVDPNTGLFTAFGAGLADAL